MSTMDHCNLPSCALNRQVTTVIIKNKMDLSERHCQYEECPNSASAKMVHRPSGCEQCKRTRLNNQYSDCDSGVVENSRTYKSRTSRGRYVNVCAVVCLLLLVGWLSPRSSAAPHSSPTMSTENSVWANPCDYRVPDLTSKYTKKNAQYIQRQARYAFLEAAKYKDEYVQKLFAVDSFDTQDKNMKETSFLRGMPWHQEDVLPAEMVLNHKMSEDKLNTLMEKIDDVLPFMHKSLKVVLAGLHTLQANLRVDDLTAYVTVANRLKTTMTDVRSVLCYFFDLMVSRRLDMLVLEDSEVPQINEQNKLELAFTIYRDTLLYLDYLSQVFQTMEKLPES